MVHVKVRETYDLKTVQDKMTVIGIHTPKPDIIKKNYPGLLMQCKTYRPVSCDVRVAAASVLPLDPLGVGTGAGDVAPEDVFNPILYKAMSNKGMSQLESRINTIAGMGTGDVNGDTAEVEVDGFTTQSDEFNLYYGLLADTHSWRHASVQRGFEMTNLRPLVYDVLANVGDMAANESYSVFANASAAGFKQTTTRGFMIGDAHAMPMINCTSYSLAQSKDTTGYSQPGFPFPGVNPANCEVDVPWVRVMCGAIIIPPSRLHSLYFRMVVEWTLEFSSIRPLGEITDFNGLAAIGAAQHYQNYSYESTKEAITGTPESVLDVNDSTMVSSNVDIKKVM